jgi:hypothetical protein
MCLCCVLCSGSVQLFMELSCFCVLLVCCAGVCIRLKELIERLFPRRSKKRRAEVEIDRQREQGRQKGHCHAPHRIPILVPDCCYCLCWVLRCGS